MLIVAINPGHDGAVAAVQDRTLLFHLESEKDSFPRHTRLSPLTIFSAIERIGATPDVIAIGGWQKDISFTTEGHLANEGLGNLSIETGYRGAHAVSERLTMFGGDRVRKFSSSHVRSHIMMAAGMAPPDDAPLRAVLVWEGIEGAFYLLDDRWAVIREIPVLQYPGNRFLLLYALAHPDYADSTFGNSSDAGKLMALAAYGDAADANTDVTNTIDRLLTPVFYPAPKASLRDSPIYNAGVEADVATIAAALLTERIFQLFAQVAKEELPRDIPLYISGGCGLNCDWNVQWRELGHFSSVFVPPCANDSGSALGTALDALAATTGDPRISWDVYSGLEFEWDRYPDPTKWERRHLDEASLADTLAGGSIVAWVQGRWEMGPRALGNRSLLAEPFDRLTRDRLNEVKQREPYRPVAPCCRIEDAGKVFDADFHDPYMLYFRMARSPDFGAITHVDGSARAQTVTKESNRSLHDLLSAFAERHGVGVLCNTSLNFKGTGFINRMSDLAHYCESRGIADMVVGDAWFQRIETPDRLHEEFRRAGPTTERKPDVLPVEKVEEIRARLLGEGRKQDAALVSTLAYAGLRRAEALQLTWEDVEGGVLHVRPATGEGSVDNETMPRSVRLLEPLEAELEELRGNNPTRNFGDLVFPGQDGGKWTSARWVEWRKQVFLPVARTCGVNAVPNDLRFTVGSLLRHEGASWEMIASQLGTTPDATRFTLEDGIGEIDTTKRVRADEQLRLARERSTVYEPRT